MKSVQSLLTLGLAAAPALAYPGHGGASLKDLAIAAKKRQGDALGPQLNLTFPGDLGTVGPTTETGNLIVRCLTADVDCYQAVPGRTFVSPGALGSDACNADICCAFDHLQTKLTPLMVDAVGQCTQFARASVRLIFHDGAAWNTSSPFGGADGSIILNDVEINNAANDGLQNITQSARGLLQEFQPFGIGAADLINFMGTLGVVLCPGGVRMRFFAGRPDNATPNDDTNTPGPTDSADFIIQNFLDKNIQPDELIALLGAHTVGQQFTFNTSMFGSPFDPTPGIWDASEFYSFTINGVDDTALKLPSDLAIMEGASSASTWAHYADPANREDWNTFFSQGLIRLGLTGVAGVNNLTDCTSVLPNQQNDTNEADFTKRMARLQ